MKEPEGAEGVKFIDAKGRLWRSLSHQCSW